MIFAHAPVLWLLLATVPALSAFLWWAWRRKRQLIGQFVQSRLLAHLTAGVSTRLQKARMVMLVAAVGLTLFVLARPQWGFEWEEARQRGLDIVVAIDTSRSMLAEDVSPNRLARAKLAALDLKKVARTDRLGLVAFAGSAFLQCPLSLDDEAFRQSVNALDVNIIPQGGTALAEAIYTAKSAFKEKSDNHKILILFTDGEDHDGQAVEAAREAAKDGMKIITVGVGTPSGELLRVTDTAGRVSFLKDDQGNAVKSRLNQKLLTDIAQATGEIYVGLMGADTMELIYARRLAPLPKGEFNAQQVRRYNERYQWFLGLALLVLLGEMLLPERKPVPRSQEILGATTHSALRQAVALPALLVLFWPAAVVASPGKALKQYGAGKFEAALREYERGIAENPSDPRLHYNAGAAAFQAKDYEKALSHFQSSLLAPDLPLQQSAFYNMGDTQFRIGESQTELSEKQQSWEQAVTSYESALKLNPKDGDAHDNLEFTRKMLEQLKQQQKQQQDQKDKDDQKKDDKKDQKDSSSGKDQKKDGQKKKDQEQPSKPDQNQENKKPEENKNASKPDPEKEKSQQKKPGKEDPKSPQPGEQSDEEEAQQQRVPLGMMTRRQAQQLLDAQKEEERAMIFVPQVRTNRPTDRVFKDW